MQHLIFPNRLTSFEDPLASGDRASPSETPPSSTLQKTISSLPGPLLELFLNLPEKPDSGQAFALHALLSTLDPSMASRWHWNDTRKVLRNLEIIKEKGIPASEVMAQQARRAEAPRSVDLRIPRCRGAQSFAI
jgi:tRNA dimethylallyltransferase